MIIFERDENGKLHQTDDTLETVSSAGRHTSFNVIQCYILHTEKEEQEFKAAQEAALAQETQENIIRAEAKKQAQLKAQQETAKQLQLDQARKEADAAQNKALLVALDEIKSLREKIEAMEAS